MEMEVEFVVEELITPSSFDVEGLNNLIPQLSQSATQLSYSTVLEICADPDVELYVARTGLEVVGMLSLVLFQIPTGVRALIEDVVVDGRVRGKSLGIALVEHALGRARVRGAKTVDLTSRPDRVAANRLYLKVGFVERETNVYRYVIENEFDIKLEN